MGVPYNNFKRTQRGSRFLFGGGTLLACKKGQAGTEELMLGGHTATFRSTHNLQDFQKRKLLHQFKDKLTTALI